jgi:hypothetical protein
VQRNAKELTFSVIMPERKYEEQLAHATNP